VKSKPIEVAQAPAKSYLTTSINRHIFKKSLYISTGSSSGTILDARQSVTSASDTISSTMKSTTSQDRATKNLKKIEKKVGITKTIEAKRRLTKQSE